jgi:hypothetical protein
MAMSARIALPVAVLGALLAGVVGLGAATMLLLFSVAGAAERAALGGRAFVVGSTAQGAPPAGAQPDVSPSADARADIPPLYLALYRQAAARYGLDWTILAGIGRVECDHGRDPAPSCTVEGQLNYAGAGGPAQFLVSTWQRYGVSATGQGVPDMWRPSDAIFSYNPAWWYVAEVLAWARRYRGAFAPARVPPDASPRRNISAIAGS